MKICNKNNSFKYELEKLCRIFLPFDKIYFTEDLETDNIYAVTRRENGENNTVLSAELHIGDKKAFYSDMVENDAEDYEKECERVLAVQLFNCFTELTGYKPQWGILTGVRPAKLYSRLTSQYGGDYADRYFKEKFLTADNKINLCREVGKSEQAITAVSSRDSFSLYISIPFCPTRCAYCSFVSHSVDKAEKLIPQYLEKLIEELAVTAKIAKDNKLKLLSVYIGGGTPTTLSSEQMERLMTAVKDNFDLSGILEYTVEAGRPDTITKDKLEVIKRLGATRISINPQTMNDEVLDIIGRRHTTEQTLTAFATAREVGFDNINMDLIAGLPHDTVDSFINTVDRVIKLNPESITVHSLSLKRASNLNQNNILPEFDSGIAASRMVDYAHTALSKNGIVPYYMYRQSKTVGNLENVGYSLIGKESFYNVYIMDETHTILACGASAVTKLREPGGSYIERIFNFKYPYEYINNFSEILSRKDRITTFYDEYRI